MKFAVCQEMFEDTPWEEQCRIIADVGYTGIEVAPFSIAEDPAGITAERARELKATAAEYGLEIIGLHWLLAKTSGFHLTSPDASVQHRTANYLIRLAEICGQLGGRVLVFGSPGQRNLPAGISPEAGLDIAAAVFREVLPAIAAEGVVLCMEPLTQQETDFINTCAEAVELMNRVDHPAFRLHQDVKAMLGAETDSVPDLIHRYRDVCGHVHVNDTNLLGPGMGETDFEPILRALRDVAYDGWVSVEVFDYRPGAETIARESFRCMHDIVSAW